MNNKGRVKNLEGKRFGRLEVTIRRGSNKHQNALWLCRCDCGKETTLTTNALTTGNTKSCGCYQKECTKRMGRMHAGMAHPSYKHGKHTSLIYKLWASMKSRCSNSSNLNYQYYGGRGISVCERWKGEGGFENFLADMGERPEGMTLDRINNDGNYEPKNCRWATGKEQIANRRIKLIENFSNEELIAECRKRGL